MACLSRREGEVMTCKQHGAAQRFSNSCTRGKLGKTEHGAAQRFSSSTRGELEKTGRESGVQELKQKIEQTISPATS